MSRTLSTIFHPRVGGISSGPTIEPERLLPAIEPVIRSREACSSASSWVGSLPTHARRSGREQPAHLMS